MRDSIVRLGVPLEVAVIALGILLMIVGFVVLPRTPYLVSCTSVSCPRPEYIMEARNVFLFGAIATALGAIALTVSIFTRRQGTSVC